jgi:histidine triad (HIT) family protein
LPPGDAIDDDCTVPKLGLPSLPHGIFIGYIYRVPRAGGEGMNECVFCRIAIGEAQSEIIYEDDQVIGLMDIRPIRPGHVQIIPREHFADFEDLPDATASRIIHLGQRLSCAMKALYGVPRVAFLFTGGDHAHAHAHAGSAEHPRSDVGEPYPQSLKPLTTLRSG